MTSLGLHLPNREFVADDLDRIAALGVQHFVDLHHFRHRWPELRQRIPGAVIHARVDARGPLDDPVQEARNFADVIRSARADTWRYRNEPNIEDVSSWREWLDWLVVFGPEVKRLCPDATIHAPAVSPGTGDWYNWLSATIQSCSNEGAPGWADGLDAHVYGNPDEVAGVLAAHRSIWPAPRKLLVSEYNFGAGRFYNLNQYAADLPRVLDVCREHSVDACIVFIWQWHQPDVELPTTVDVRDTIMETAIREEAKTMSNDGNNDGNIEQWRELVARYFPIDEVDNALAVMRLESGGDPNARATVGEDSRGLFQLNLVAHPQWAGYDLYNPEQNVQIASWLFADQGWRPWTAARVLGLVKDETGDTMVGLNASEVPESWRQYGATWPEIAANLLGVANDALSAGREIRDLAQQIVDRWGTR